MSMRLLSSENGNSGLLFVGFNQDFGCFAVGMQNGFRIYNTDPLKELDRYEFNVRDGTGIGYVEMLFRTSFLGLLGGGHQARVPANTACLWDGVEQKIVLELSYGSDVRTIRLRRDRIVVVLSNAVKVYTFGASPELVYQAETCPNPLGLCHLCQALENPLLAFPGRKVGSVTLAMACTSTSSPPPRQILAHENPLVALTMTTDGSRLATASQRGTLIRIFSTVGTGDCELLHELRRGSNAALVTCICFNAPGSRLAVASTHGTVHVFDNLNAAMSSASSTSSAAGLTSSGRVSVGGSGRQILQPIKTGRLLPRYFSSTLSQIRCTLDTKFKTICAFSLISSNTFIVLAADGSYCKYNFTDNGVVTKEQSLNFLDFYDDENDL